MEYNDFDAIKRFKEITKYIFEQEETPVEPVDDVPTGDVPTGDVPMGDVPMGDETEVIDVQSDPDVEEIGNEKISGDDETEVLDITELVTSQKDISTKQEEIFSKLDNQMKDMENLLGQMNNIFSKINDIEVKIEKYRPKTPQEKLELKSLDSYPYNQKLTDFFKDKEDELEASGKNEYVLTPNDVENFSQREIEDSFIPPQIEDYAEDID